MCLWIEEVLENGTAGERSPRERSDELARVRRGHDGDAGPELRELTQQVDGLVRGDAAGDAEDQLLVRELMLGRDHAHAVPRTRSVLGRVVVLHAIAHLALCDLLERDAGRLGVLLLLDLVLCAAVELTRALGGQDDEQVAVGHLLEGLLQGREHHSGTSMSGNLSLRRPVRQRSAWMMAASWSEASFTSRLMMR